MTAVNGQNTYSNTATGPTPGTPRTAASVRNTGIQQPMNNTWALANGYARKAVVNLLLANVTETPAAFIFCDANGSAATQNQTIQFEPVAINHYWKHVYIERITKGTVLTFQGGAPYATFYTWTAPADMSDAWLIFNHSSSSGTWNFCGAQWSRGNCREIEVSVAGTSSVTTTPREIHLHSASGLPVGTNNLDLDGDYNSGDRVDVFVRGVKQGSFAVIRDNANATIFNVDPIRDGTDVLVALQRNGSAWTVMGCFRATRYSSSTPEMFANVSAVDQTLALNQKHYSFGSVSSNIQLTLADGEYVGQEVHLHFDFIAFGITVGIAFTGSSPASGATISGVANWVHWGAVWDNLRWRVL